MSPQFKPPSLDLLHAPLITVQTANGNEGVTLPGLLASLTAGHDVQGFPALQPHQKHAWFAFLVQLAALVRARVHDPGTDEVAWREALLTLAGHPTAFCLVVPDVAQPAFLQPPVNAADLKRDTTAPDDLDITVTTKSHDLKSVRLTAPTAEHWLFALLNLQTMQGFSGRANYGIARMNGGFSNRPGIGLAAGPGFSQRFQRDVEVLLHQRPSLLGQYAEWGDALLWTLPWTTDASLALASLDPFFIEICRRVRLTSVDGRLTARIGSSNAARIETGETKGVLGDAWTPVNPGEGKALTVDGRGITWELLQRLLLTSEFEPGAAQERADDDPDRIWLACWALVRGQGKTEGLHERWLELPARMDDIRRRPDAWQKVMKMSQERVDQYKTMKNKVLTPALLRLAVDADQKALPSDHDGHLRRFTDRLEAWVDAHYFALLWPDADQSGADRDLSWQRALWAETERIFHEACRETAMPGPRRYARLSRAAGLLRGCLRKQFLALSTALATAPAPTEATPTEGVPA